MGVFYNARRVISEEDLKDLHGKVAIVTGSSAGIGFATIPFLARKGAKVYMASPDEQESKEALARLKQGGIGDGSVHWLRLDLADPRSAKKAAQEILEKEARLDILINNGEKAAGPFLLTKDGLKDTMVINYLSHFIFTETLLPMMIRTSKAGGSDVRIINLTSSLHFRVAPTRLSGKESFNTDHGDNTAGRLLTYSFSKLATILHIKHLQRRINAQRINITCLAVDPGLALTETLGEWIDSMSFILGKVAGFLAPFVFWSPREGAMNSAFAAASPEVTSGALLFKGTYLTPVGNITEPSHEANNDRLANELYNTTMDILEEMNLKVVGIQP